MRSTLRLLASAKPNHHLTPYAPTGLTGLDTHPSPRATLHTIYDQTLQRLKQLPESSIYRQSCESVTLRRYQAVLNAKPAGYDAWHRRIEEIVKGGAVELVAPPKGFLLGRRSDGSYEIPPKKDEVVDRSKVKKETPWTEGGIQSEKEAEAKLQAIEREQMESRLMEELGSVEDKEGWSPEPPLSAEEISDLEQKIGAGLIEEVIQVAEGELKLVDEMTRSKAWEPLIEKPQEGQWQYFERSQK